MVGCLVRRAAVVDLKNDYASAVVIRYFVDSRKNRGLDLVAADIDELFFDLFGIVQPFYSALIVDAEDYRAATGICQRYYFSDDFVGVDEPNLKLEVSVLSAPNQTEQIISI